ncbi:carbonic anhydrase [Burkholderia sp. AW33-5]
MCDSKKCAAEVAGGRRRSFLRKTSGVAFASLVASALPHGFAVAASAEASPPKPQNELSPDDSIRRLMEGNARYVSGVTRRHDFAYERKALNEGQNPYAAILGCADSRVAPEYAFDSGRGDLFVTRVAGNFVNDDVLGSLEYAVAVLEVPVIVVLGHDKCGAVDAAIKAAKQAATFPGKIQAIADAILPAVQQVKTGTENLLGTVIEQNVRRNVANLRAESEIIRNAERAGTLKVVGGIYRLDSGKVEFLT